ncbi:MFS transporter [Zestomonas thermotolerans]|uniref:MFS transporter n=1 Tax=Zestomonas thermotolerans TaxID=157784 RepID=UPI0023F21EB0|nr:MFS transporter [Pseudomonas thermotolerans]
MKQTTLSFTSLILATIIAVLDISAVNLAIPTIAQDLGYRVEQTLWLSKANLLACAVSILPISAIGDVIGHRRILFIGLGVFALTSLGCVIASELWILIGLRTVQGCAGAAIMCSTLVLLREIYPASKLGMALGLNALFVAVTTTSAPAISGLILSTASWRWLFSIGPVLAVLAMAVGYLHLPEKHQSGSRFDWLGSILMTLMATLFLLCYVQMIRQPRWRA